MTVLQNCSFPLHGWLSYIQGELIEAGIKEGVPGEKALGVVPFSPAEMSSAGSLKMSFAHMWGECRGKRHYKYTWFTPYWITVQRLALFWLLAFINYHIPLFSDLFHFWCSLINVPFLIKYWNATFWTSRPCKLLCRRRFGFFFLYLLYFLCVPTWRMFSSGPWWAARLPWIPAAWAAEGIVRLWKQQK